jgi:5-methylthioadenosine/S-adenosylhomocysteine deaminase
MPTVPADLSISCGWIMPMTRGDALLPDHTLVVRDGRILDLLPSEAAAARYSATVVVDRTEHLLLPGLVNARAELGAPGPAADRHTQALLCVAELLKAGTTCFCSTRSSPDATARLAASQGLRVVIGIPIAAGDDLTPALRFHDEFREHPLIATAFAPHAPTAISDEAFARIATLVNELDTGVLLSLHRSHHEIEESLARHGVRPLERMQLLGLLTPAMTAAHMSAVNQADIELAQRAGIAITFCPQADLRSGYGIAPLTSWARSGLRLSVGSGTEEVVPNLDLWSEVRQLALLPGAAHAGDAAFSAWDALSIATRGGAAALGLESQIGTLELGKWADLCCIDFRHPALQRVQRGEPANALVFNGGRDVVSDVWVAGRHRLNDGIFTRIDWAELTARADLGFGRATSGGQ